MYKVWVLNSFTVVFQDTSILLCVLEIIWFDLYSLVQLHHSLSIYLLCVTFSVESLFFCLCENGLEMPIIIHVQKPWVIGCMNVKFEMPNHFPKLLPQITFLLATFKRDSGDTYLLQYLIFYASLIFVNQVDVAWHFIGVLVFISLG